MGARLRDGKRGAVSGLGVGHHRRFIRGALTAVIVVALALLHSQPARSNANAGPGARAATNQLLETITVGAAKTTATTGTVQLKHGTKYQLQVTGTFTITGPGGQGYDYDALYCYGDFGFLTGTPPQCQPPMQEPNFFVSVGSGPLKEIDAYQTPTGGTTNLGYNTSHHYVTDFYPPADGTLRAGGWDAYTHCKSQPTPCQDVIAGTVTIQIYGPSPRGGGGSGGGGSSGGGGGTLPPPVLLPTPTQFGQQVSANVLRGGAAGVYSPPLGNASSVNVTVGGISPDDVAAMEDARHRCYVDFTRNIVIALARYHEALTDLKRSAKELDELFALFVPGALVILRADLDECVALTNAVEAALALSKLEADPAAASCAMTPIKLSVSRSGRRTHLKSVHVLRRNAGPLKVTCAPTADGLRLSISTRSTHTPLSSIVGSRLRLAVVRSRRDTAGGPVSVVFNQSGSSSQPPDLTGAWRNRDDLVSPAWQLTVSGDRQTLDASWTGGPGHTGLRGSFHGALTQSGGSYAYQGTFQVTEGATVSTGPASFTIDNANQIEVNLQANGGQPSHYVLVPVGS
jgi:hypothetical protein